VVAGFCCAFVSMQHDGHLSKRCFGVHDGCKSEAKGNRQLHLQLVETHFEDEEIRVIQSL